MAGNVNVNTETLRLQEEGITEGRLHAEEKEEVVFFFFFRER